MRVLQKGDGRKGWATEATCTGKGNGDGGCGAKLLVEEEDLFYTISAALHETYYLYTTFRCPGCTVLTDIKTIHKITTLPSWKEWSESHKLDVKLR